VAGLGTAREPPWGRMEVCSRRARFALSVGRGERARRAVAALAVGAVALAVASGPARGDEGDDLLTAAEVHKYFEPYVPAVRDCYATHARSKSADGNLRLELIIQPDGGVFHFGFAAPGVTAPWLGKLDGCLRGLARGWHFPVRRRFTTAVLPFLFQSVRAPGAGPIESCWDARGCPPGKPRGDK
jgi:hypothetical protein